VTTWFNDYNEQGYHFPVRAFSKSQAQQYRTVLEALESSHQNDPDLKLAIGQANYLIPFVDEISRSDAVLDPVKKILGPNILVWNSSFFIKEPKTEDFVSWHQDLTYWGLTDNHEVTAWIALTQASVLSGCMKFVPGTHTGNIVEHRDTFDKNNLLSRGQELSVEAEKCRCITARYFTDQTRTNQMTGVSDSPYAT